MNIYQDNGQPGGGWNNNYNNEWQNGDPLRQDPFIHRPPLSAKDRLSATSLSMAIASLISTIFMTVIVPLILAPISIVLAVISKGSDRKIRGRAKNAVVVASLAIIINCVMIVSSFVSMFLNPQIRANINQVMVPTYGVTVEQEIEAFDADFGTNLTSHLRGDSSQYSSGLFEEGGSYGEDL